MLVNTPSEEIFPYVQPEPLLEQLETISPCPVASHLGEKAILLKASPKPHFLQAKQPQLPQLLLL